MINSPVRVPEENFTPGVIRNEKRKYPRVNPPRICRNCKQNDNGYCNVFGNWHYRPSDCLFAEKYEGDQRMEEA
ncbi:hypothetical protein D7024_09535 [Desulfofundulus salinus]|uniref:Uncharacterized protein n=1 Tax=Desulfofundulus salinus TaxID=2419843 RepID=A0A494X1U3_9FIRM|nr:hypothetical protein D7024_09535 [Desulfofundulus salinum]